MSYLLGLKCKGECAREYDKQAIYACEYCFGPLEVVYDYEKIGRVFTRQKIESRTRNLWRYRELLPIDGDPQDGLLSGYTPLVPAPTLARRLGLRELWIKNDGVNFPTLSYKDRVVPVAISRARELGFDTIGCASTGNLANSVAAHGARAGLRCVIFIPSDLEASKVIASQIYDPDLVAVEGNYDDVNRLCSEIAAKYRWAFVNVNMRPYYTEGAKTYGFEIAEQLGWRLPDNLVCPVAGGTILPRIWKAFSELERFELTGPRTTRMYAAQAEACAPVIRALHGGHHHVAPVKPLPKSESIDTSLRIGKPADGDDVLEALKTSGGWGEMATNEEIIEAIKLLASTEGIFTETAGGTTLAVTQKLVEQGRIDPDGLTVICITGNGLKTIDAVAEALPPPSRIQASLPSFEQRLPAAV